MFNKETRAKKSIKERISNYLKIRKQYGRLYLKERHKGKNIFDFYGLQSIRPLRLDIKEYDDGMISEDDGVLIKGNDMIRFWTTLNRQTIFITRGKGVYKKSVGKPIEEIGELYNIEFIHNLHDKAVMFSSKKDDFYTIRILFLEDGRISNPTYVDSYCCVTNLKGGIETKNREKYQYFYFDVYDKWVASDTFRTRIQKGEKYQALCGNDGKYRIYKVSRAAGIKLVGDDTDVFESVKRLHGIPGVTHIGVVDATKSKIFTLYPRNRFKSYEIPGGEFKLIESEDEQRYYQVLVAKEDADKNGKKIIKKYVHLLWISEDGVPEHLATYEGEGIKIGKEVKKVKKKNIEWKTKIEVIGQVEEEKK